MSPSWCSYSEEDKAHGISPEAICGCAWGMIFVLWFIALPVTVYNTYRFYIHKHLRPIEQRRPAIVLIILLILLLYTTITATIDYLASSIGIFSSANNNGGDNSTFNKLRILYTVHILAVFTCIVWRVYVIYFDLNYAQDNASHAWKNLLLEGINNRNSVVSHRKTIVPTATAGNAGLLSQSQKGSISDGRRQHMEAELIATTTTTTTTTTAIISTDAKGDQNNIVT
ncbi:hypothetical protein RFI_19599, partial [Reticulomyxa filosa]